MNKATPDQLRTSLKAATMLIDAGIAFIPVPIIDEDHKKDLGVYVDKLFNNMIDSIETEATVND